jgi:hypothetical protein
MHLEVQEAKDALESGDLGKLALGDLSNLDGMLQFDKSAGKSLGVRGESTQSIDVALASAAKGGSDF